MKNLTEQDRVLLKTLAANPLAGLSLEELRLACAQAGFVVTLDGLKAAMQGFVGSNLASFERVSTEWRYFVTRRGLLRAGE